jgi:hypothetical protein
MMFPDKGLAKLPSDFKGSMTMPSVEGLTMMLQCPSPLCRFSYKQSHMQFGLHVALTILNSMM